MASSYSADLKLELMATGEKSGLWGDITNTNLIILQLTLLLVVKMIFTVQELLLESNG